MAETKKATHKQNSTKSGAGKSVSNKTKTGKKGATSATSGKKAAASTGTPGGSKKKGGATPAFVAGRTAEQIAVTSVGPRPVPELSTARTASHPELLTRTIDNGLRVIAVRKPGTPLVEVRLRVPFGGSTAAHSARAEVLAATLLLGTGSRTREQVDAELAVVGGHLDCSVDPQRLAVTGSVLSTGLPVLLDVLAESLVEPAFRRHDVLGERDRLVEHLAIAASQPSVVARAHLQTRRFGNHPATREMPDPAVVATVGVAALRSLQQKALLPAGSTLVLVGDIEPDRALTLVEVALSRWSAPGTAQPLSSPHAVVGGAVKAFHRDGAVQSQVRLSAAALERTDPDYAAGQLANLIYGGYFSSRLVENIREDKGYTYSAHSSFEFWPARAAVTVSFDTTTPSTAAALLEARYELGRLALNPPEPKEVESARNYALGTLATSLATQAGYASTLSSLAGLGLDVDWVREHPARLSAVTVDDVTRVAGTLLAPTGYTGVVVGDLEVIGSSLTALGGVEL
ncbi:Predicted Zn-dependent peptidase [Nakamurella panacisegetis]|uniref:Predicted Zn-dependent peptidase n=1 Tax=Nakamurella panacisegetis TaxID=1090615 RepID=A0A1H0HQ32_9ACTN|nr:pitrilysin family protein [Nakamurella panacisegetis]SDO21315.1 Predicted Zn-dependent peptidase [Nakamurella panacisegetis]